MKRKRSGGRFDVAAETVERHQDDVGITLAKFRECVAKGVDVARPDFLWSLSSFCLRSSRPEIHEVKFEHADAVVIPVLHCVHEVREKAAFGKRHFSLLCSEGT